MSYTLNKSFISTIQYIHLLYNYWGCGACSPIPTPMNNITCKQSIIVLQCSLNINTTSFIASNSHSHFTLKWYHKCFIYIRYIKFQNSTNWNTFLFLTLLVSLWLKYLKNIKFVIHTHSGITSFLCNKPNICNRMAHCHFQRLGLSNYIYCGFQLLLLLLLLKSNKKV